MGLRHMFVSPPHPLVSGMVTRKDIISGGCPCRLRQQRQCLPMGCMVCQAGTVAQLGVQACGRPSPGGPLPCTSLGSSVSRTFSCWTVASPTRKTLASLPALFSADNAKLALGRKANMGLADSQDAQVEGEGWRQAGRAWEHREGRRRDAHTGQFWVCCGQALHARLPAPCLPIIRFCAWCLLSCLGIQGTAHGLVQRAGCASWRCVLLAVTSAALCPLPRLLVTTLQVLRRRLPFIPYSGVE